MAAAGAARRARVRPASAATAADDAQDRIDVPRSDRGRSTSEHRELRAAQRRIPASIATPVAGTTIALATTAYGATSPNVAALSGQTPIWVAIVSASASRTRSGESHRSSAWPIGAANSTIAPTHENDKANEIDVTEAGQSAATTPRRARRRSRTRAEHRTRVRAARPRPSSPRAARQNARR